MSMKHTAIPKWVSVAVWKRDNEVLHRLRKPSRNAEQSHRKAKPGRSGSTRKHRHTAPECHRLYDSYDKEVRKITMDYIMKLYPDWTRESVTYRKHKKEVDL